MWHPDSGCHITNTVLTGSPLARSTRSLLYPARKPVLPGDETQPETRRRRSRKVCTKMPAFMSSPSQARGTPRTAHPAASPWMPPSIISLRARFHLEPTVQTWAVRRPIAHPWAADCHDGWCATGALGPAVRVSARWSVASARRSRAHPQSCRPGRRSLRLACAAPAFGVARAAPSMAGSCWWRVAPVRPWRPRRRLAPWISPVLVLLRRARAFRRVRALVPCSAVPCSAGSTTRSAPGAKQPQTNATHEPRRGVSTYLDGDLRLLRLRLLRLRPCLIVLLLLQDDNGADRDDNQWRDNDAEQLAYRELAAAHAPACKNVAEAFGLDAYLKLEPNN